ncbi:MAG TPA: ATP-binding cassette domain-containing protein [Xanthomonadales bacterium]|nr:ATP-binding cassette domain-containing protein [Xanthomonadales bacterium]
MTAPILQVTDLTKRFGGVNAVYNVSFELQAGAALGIIGPNGSGKTTLVNLITGYVRPDKGRVLYRGRDITAAMPYTTAQLGVARSFQMVRPFTNLPAFKNLIVPLFSPRVRKLRGGRFGNRDEIAVDLLEEVGFERDSPVPYKSAGSLPHGYLKRLELARCLSLEPDLIILDELFSGMSMSEVASILPLIHKIREEGKSLIMVEHRLRELFRVVDQVMVLNFGLKIAAGLPEDVLEDEEVKRAYLGTEVQLDA